MELGNVKWGKVYYIEHSNDQNKKILIQLQPISFQKKKKKEKEDPWKRWMRSEIQIPCYLYFVQLFSWAFGRRCTTILFIQKEVNSWILFVKAMNIVLWYFLVGSIFFWLPSDAVLVFYKSNFEKHEHLLAGKKKKKNCPMKTPWVKYCWG